MKQRLRQQGQTIIETMVALLILSMGLGAAAGLASYAFNTSSNIVKQVVGMGLAREGLEAVKNMRDTNWLKGSLSDTCYNFVTSVADASCYPTWLDQLYDISPVGGNQSGGADSDNANATLSTYKLRVDSTAGNSWVMGNESADYSLYYYANGSNGYYSTTPNTVPSGYFRRISLSESPVGPFGSDVAFGRILVTSDVWWNGKRCPVATQSAPPSSGSCRIKLKMYLTNWKNY